MFQGRLNCQFAKYHSVKRVPLPHVAALMLLNRLTGVFMAHETSA